MNSENPRNMFRGFTHVFTTFGCPVIVVWLRNAAILDLSKMAHIERAQLGSLEKLVTDGHI